MTINIKVKNGTEKMTSNSGLALIGTMLEKTRIEAQVNNVAPIACRSNGFSNYDMLSSMIGLITIGKPDFDAIEAYREDIFFPNALNLDKCPSSPALRQRLDLMGESCNGILKEESALLIKNTAPAISPLHTSCGEYIPLDMDVSPFDNSRTKKEGVSMTYKGHDGYAPMFAYLGTEGYLVNVELREGKQHCQKNTPEFISETIQNARKITEKPILARLDSGNDSRDNFTIMADNGVDFIVKRNLRREPRDQWIDKAKETGIEVPCREGKRRWIGVTETDIHGKALDFPIIFDVTERTIVKGQNLIFPEHEIDTYWCSVRGFDPKEVIDLYHDHGTSEQFHSELKSDMDLERFPSGRFSTNSLILVLGMLSYNMLRIIGQHSISVEVKGSPTVERKYRKKVARRRVRTVVQDMIYMAGRLIRSGRQWFLSFGSMNPFSVIWEQIFIFLKSVPGPS